MAILEVENLRKKFVKKGLFWRKKIEVLRGVFLKVEREIFGFIGPNGAGKTTTIKIIMGLIRPDAGRVSIFGKEIEKAKPLVGFLPERPYIYSSIRAIDYLDFCCDVYQIPYYERRKKIGELLELMELLGREEETISSYSKGMVQRLLFASILINEPEVLILDEPMSGLDPVGRSTIARVIKELKDKGKTVFYSSHILQDVEKISERVAIIVDGEIRLCDSVSNLVSRFLKGYSITYRHPEKGLQTEEVAKDLFWEKLHLLKLQGVEILAVDPLRLSLEDIFVKLVKGENLEIVGSG